jgi:hypothetical protein
LGVFIGEAKASVEEIHRAYAKAGEEYPRLIPFAGMDPRRGGSAVDLLVKCVTDWGIKGLKVCAYGYTANDPVCYPLYEKCQEFGIPVSIHTGLDGYPLKCRDHRPMVIDDVAVDFPDLTLTLTHAGPLPLWGEAALLALAHSNVYLEISAWQKYLKKTPAYFYRVLRNFIDLLGKHKVVFGTDWPDIPAACGVSMAEWVTHLQNLPREAKAYGATFTQDEVDAIMGQNAARILKL